MATIRKTIRRVGKTLKKKGRQTLKTIGRKLYNIPIKTQYKLTQYLPMTKRKKQLKLQTLENLYAERKRQREIRNLEENIRTKSQKLNKLQTKMNAPQYVTRKQAHEKQKQNILLGLKSPSNYNFSIHLNPKYFYKAQKLERNLAENERKLARLLGHGPMRTITVF